MEDNEPLLVDHFIKTHLNILLRKNLMKRIQQFVSPFTRVKLSFISQGLGVSYEEVEELLVALILDIKIVARIDQESGVLLTEAHSASLCAIGAQ